MYMHLEELFIHEEGGMIRIYDREEDVFVERGECYQVSTPNEQLVDCELFKIYD